METKTVQYASKAKPWLRYLHGAELKEEALECSLYDTLYSRGQHHLDQCAIAYYGTEISYAELFLRIRKTADALQKLHIGKGDCITLVAPKLPEVIFLFYAANLIGASVNAVDPRYNTESVQEYIQEVQSRLVVTIDLAYPRVQKAIEGTKAEKILVISPADSLQGAKRALYRMSKRDKNRYDSNVVRWPDFFASGEDKMPDYSVNPGDCALIVHTGGTTGTPKGVMLSARAINAVAYQFVQCVGSDGGYANYFEQGQTILDVMPPFIAYGFICGTHMPLYYGFQDHIIPNLNPAELGKLMVRHKPSLFFGVPSHFLGVTQDPKMKKADFSFATCMAAGGDAVTPAAEEQVSSFLKAHHAPFGLAKGYGMTEVSSAVSFCLGKYNKVGSAGIPLGMTVIAAFKEGTDQEVPLGEHGEICIHCPQAMLGYYEKPEETAKVLRRHSDGKNWIHTGDIGYVDEDGYLFLDNRIKRLIIRADGFKIFPSMIENAVATHPAIENCSAVAMKDEKHTQGKLPFVFFTLKQDAEADKHTVIKELKAICKEHLAEYMQPEGFHCLEAMPLTGAGKVDYRALEERLQKAKEKVAE